MSDKTDLINVVELILKKWWVILCAMLAGGLLFYSYTAYLVDPIYVSSGSIYVNNLREKKSDNINMSDMAASQLLVFTYIEILNSDTFMTIVAEDSGLDYDYKQVRDMISMQVKNDTEVMQITASDTDPEHAQMVVAAVLRNVEQEIIRVMQGGSVVVVDQASLPKQPSSPNVPLNTIVGAFIGFSASILLFVLIDLLDIRIKNEDDLSETYHLPVLGVIPKFEQTKVRGGKA